MSFTVPSSGTCNSTKLLDNPFERVMNTKQGVLLEKGRLEFLGRRG